MEENTDLRLLTKRLKIFKCLTIVFCILAPLSLLGVGLKFPYSYIFVTLCGLLFIAAVTFAVLMRKTMVKIEKTVTYLRAYRDHLVANNNAILGYLSATYVNVNCKECGELNQVTFVRENLVFSAEGKFCIKKDFKGIEGNCLAFQIRGTKMISSPENYDDVLDHESNLFTLNVGYFEDRPFTDEENDTGLTLPEGHFTDFIIPFSSNNGYVCNLDTEESDEIDRGELFISEMTEDSLTVSFKCMVGYGAAEVICGKVKLTRDSED
ncbi:MAG: hypothetical protein K2L02_02995 [Clostridia bacterium]|nr:hypothetical protein [Clostridia bacterium]